MSQEDTSIAADAIMKLGTGFFASRTLLSAVELGLFTHLSDAPLEQEVLRQRLGLHERCAGDFFDALVALGMLKKSGGKYSNTRATATYLDRTKPGYRGAYLEMASRRLFGYWNHLTDALKSGSPQNEHDHWDAFAAIYSTGESVERFVAEMHDVSLPLVDAISTSFPWEHYRTVVDVGTCKGAFPVALLKLRPHLSGGGFDLPEVGAAFKTYVERNGLQERLQFYPGNFHHDPLPRADVLVFGHVLVDWGIQTKKMLLSKAFSALPHEGAVIVYEMVLDDERRYNAAGLLMSLNMAIETREGGNCTGGQLSGWMREAGFSSTRVIRLSASHSMVIGTK